jgi:hypothetical protein
MPSPSSKKGNLSLVSAIPFLLVAIALIAAYRAMGESIFSPPSEPLGSSGHGDYHFRYSTVTGFFMQDEAETIPSVFDAVRFASNLLIVFRRRRRKVVERGIIHAMRSLKICKRR